MSKVLYTVECVDNSGLEGELVLASFYDVVSEDLTLDTPYLTILNEGEKLQYKAYRFIKLSEVVESSEAVQIKSTGGSSSYYDFRVWSSIEGRYVEFKMGDFIRDGLYNSFDLGNMAKALKRVAEVRNGGGKAGTDEEYDLNKVIYFAEEELKIKEMKDATTEEG